MLSRSLPQALSFWADIPRPGSPTLLTDLVAVGGLDDGPDVGKDEVRLTPEDLVPSARSSKRINSLIKPISGRTARVSSLKVTERVVSLLTR